MFYNHYLSELSLDNVVSAIRDYQENECHHIRKFYRYYNGLHDVLNRTTTEGRPCSKVVSNEVRKICDLYNGFVGACDIESNDQYFKDIQPEIQDAIKDALIAGVGYGLVLYNEQLTFKRIAPTTAMLFRDTTINHNVIAGAFWSYYNVVENGFDQEYIDLYVVDENYMYYYRGKTLEGLALEDSWTHNIPGIPLVEFRPDSHYDSCFSPAISLQDMLNMTLSSYQDGRETFSDGFMVITGIGISEESANSLIDGDKKILNLPLPDAHAEYLIKDDKAADVVVMLDDITERLYRSCSVPLTEDVRMGTASAAALAAKYLALTRTCASLRTSFDLTLEDIADMTTKFTYEWPEPFEDVTSMEADMKGAEGVTSDEGSKRLTV